MLIGPPLAVLKILLTGENLVARKQLIVDMFGEQLPGFQIILETELENTMLVVQLLPRYSKAHLFTNTPPGF